VIRCAINFLFTFLLLVILVYPSSTILFPPNFIDPRSFYVAVALLIIFDTWRKTKESFSGPHYQLLIIFLIIFEIFFIIKYLIEYQESYILKNIIIGFLLLVIVTREKKYTQNKIFQLISILSSIILFSCVILFIYLLTDSINSKEFSAINLQYLNSLNPAITRPDFNYLIPWYLTTIPVGLVEDFFLGLEYQRYTNIFTEWTYLWYFVCPILIIHAQKNSISNLLFIIQIIVILILGLSVWGLGSLILSYMISYFLKVTNLLKVLILIFSLFFYFIVFFDVDFTKILLDGIGSYRYEQLSYYSGAFNLNTITLLGNVLPPTSEDVIWGATYIFWQYGIVGFGFFILMQIYSICIAMKILCRPDAFSNQDRSLSTTVIFLVLMGLKTPIFFSFLQICIVSVLSRNLDLKI